MNSFRMALAASIAAASLALAACDEGGMSETAGEDSAMSAPGDTGGGTSPDTPVSSAPAPGTASTARAGAGDVDNNPPGDPCGASKVATFVSQKATPAVRSRIAAEVGHGTIRWIGPDTAVTEDYSPQRLNVTLDANDVITGANCG